MLLLVLLLAVLSLSGQDDAAYPGKNLKVISYNIWNGLEWGKDSRRKDKLIEWMHEQQPDVVALQELCGFTRERLSELAESWGHPYAEILKTRGYPVGITSRKPIELKERIFESMHHGAMHCETFGMDFMVIHFSPSSYKKRLQEAEIILGRMSEIRKEQQNYVVLGDFNALSPFDADYYKDKLQMLESLRASEANKNNTGNLFNGELEYGCISSFLGFPLMDVVQKFTSGLDARISFPTQVFEKEKGEGRRYNSCRIDYILASPELAQKCLGARILNGPDTYYLSDHYPVLAEFEY